MAQVLTAWFTCCLLVIHCCQEVDVQNRKAIIVYVPVPQLRAFQKIQPRLVREMEKKFSGKHVVIIAQVSSFFSAFSYLKHQVLNFFLCQK